MILFPLTVPLAVCRRWSRRWDEIVTDDEDRATAEDEIMSLVEQAAADEDEEPGLEPDERRMIRGIFDLDEMLVREIMTPRVDVDAVEDILRPADIKAEIVRSKHSRIPVFHETIDRIVGVIHAKDLLEDDRLARLQALDELFRKPVFIPETKNVGDLLEEFQQNSNHFAVVLDEYGGTAGIVTIEDILEEIVGEIRDEYDVNEPVLTKQALPDGNLVVDARMTIDELSDTLDIQIPENEDYDTLGGYILAHAGRIPQAGETVETDVLSIEVVSGDPRRVLTAKVRKRPELEDLDAP
jgi:CBS domain containing-hemolysin-like protein